MEVIVTAMELKAMPIGTEFFCKVIGTGVHGDIWKTVKRKGAVVMENMENGKLRTIQDRSYYEFVLC